MNFYIVIPAHNEEDSIALTLESLTNQTIVPKRVVVVNDNSTDNSQSIIEQFVKNHDYISIVNTQSSDNHLPGTKIINAFYKGFETLDTNYDVICKFDADLIFPENYLEKLAYHFNKNKSLGMVAGFCYIQKNNKWILENLTGKDHIRGALKAYRKECFIEIGQLKRSIGWDTIDELLAWYYNWQFMTDASLHVKHLKPTGSSYNKGAKLMQGEAMYKIRLGFALTFLTGLKMAFKKRKPSVLKDYLAGYLKAMKNKIPQIVSEDQGQFIRKTRWKGVLRQKS